MSRRSKNLTRELAQLEDEFSTLLIPCLQQAAQGRANLCGEIEVRFREVAPYVRWDDANRLSEVALRIQALRAEFGMPNPAVERFLALRESVTYPESNHAGLRKLADQFLIDLVAEQAEKATR